MLSQHDQQSWVDRNFSELEELNKNSVLKEKKNQFSTELLFSLVNKVATTEKYYCQVITKTLVNMYFLLIG